MVERWLAAASVGLFAMFAGQMVSVYSFMSDVPDDFAFAASFDADPKLLQFISISVAPAGILAGVAFLMSRQYGSRPVGAMIMAGGAIMLAGMLVTHAYLGAIDPRIATDAIYLAPPLFAALSAPVMATGAYLFLRIKKRPRRR